MLEKLITAGEGPTIEFKSTVDSAFKIAKTLSAFANTKGGTLLVGVSDSGKITGIQSELQEMQKIEQAASLYCEPVVELSYQVFETAGRQVLAIYIGESEQKPHAVRDGSQHTVYVRAKDKSVPTGQGMIKVLQNGSSAPVNNLSPSRNIKTLLTFLRKHESVTIKKYAKMINVSEGRAASILKELVWQGILLIHDKQTPVTYSLK
jgi:predicted HTH transcriptional regulator